MSFAGESAFESVVDVNDPSAFERKRFDDALKGAQERRTVLDAISLAHGLTREVSGDVPGYILHYLRDMQNEAVEAMANLISAKTMTEEQRVTARLQIQPYAHLMGWMKDRIIALEGAKVNLEDMNLQFDGPPEG